MKSSLYPMKSIGLSDLGTDLVRLIALRAMLVSDRSYGAERHRMRSSVPTEHPDTSIDCSIAKGCEYTNPTPSLGLKDHLDTSIARQGYDHRDPTFLGLKDRRIIRIASRTAPLTSADLSGLFMMALPPHSPALRFVLCWYRFGLSVLNCRMSQLALKECFDTSIARKGYEQIHPGFLGLKDRWIFSLVGASSNPA